MTASRSTPSKKVPKAERFEAENRAAACIILQDPLRHGGGDSLAVRWAHMVRDGYQPTEKTWRLSA